MSENNKQRVRRAVDEIWTNGKFELIQEIADRNIVVHTLSSAGDICGIDGLIAFYQELRKAFPDIRFSVEDQIAEGDMVVTRWAATATHTGEYQGFPPTNKHAVMSGIDIDRFSNGKVAECWSLVDELGFLQQLGVIPGREITVS